MTSLIVIPFLIGSVPLGLAVVGANHFLKDKRKTNKFLYWGGITASAFIGWSVSNMLMKRYVVSEVLGADTFTMSPSATPPFTPSRYFYRWVGQLPHHSNPIMYGNPDAFELGGKGFQDAELIHYVSPLYDEWYVQKLVDKLNKYASK